MSLIPKISIGMPRKREKLSLDFDNSTTFNFGVLQPTMCREMVPKETFNVKVASLVRLSPLAVPTFGRVSLRHYHCFVPYNKLWEPFDCFLSNTPYSADGSLSQTPGVVPTWRPGFYARNFILKYSDITVYRGYDVSEDNAITFNPEGKTQAEIDAALDEINTAMLSLFPNIPYAQSHTLSNIFGKSDSRNLSMPLASFNFGGYGFSGEQGGTATFSIANRQSNLFVKDNAIVTASGADYIVSVTDNTDLSNPIVFTYCMKLKPIAKRLRSLFIGLGYGFNPYDDTQFNVFKLFAYAASVWELFHPHRDTSFSDSNIYKAIHKIRKSDYWTDVTTTAAYDVIAGLVYGYEGSYYFPIDYFSMATTSPVQTPSQGLVISTPYPDNQKSVAVQMGPNGTTNRPPVGTSNTNSQASSFSPWANNDPLAMRMAMRLLTFANKNTIIGRSIRDYLKTHYGVEANDAIDASGVYRIGESRVNVQISDVMSTAQTTAGVLGEYAGKGIGYGDSEKFDFTAEDFGCWLTISVIVPESGYYQGYLLENRQSDRFQFFTNEFDALGYQLLERGELINDYNCDGKTYQPGTQVSPTTGFGFVPRYSHLKVGRNIINGDLSIPGLQASNSAYTLDRKFPVGLFINGPFKMTVEGEGDAAKVKEITPTVVIDASARPDTVSDRFREMDFYDYIGQYNRIFTYQHVDVDHFIVNMIFNVDAMAPMKSLSTSFDTYSGDADDTSVNITKS